MENKTLKATHRPDWLSVITGNHHRLLLLLWAVFLLRGFFYLSFTPLWEGFDEPAHRQ